MHRPLSQPSHSPGSQGRPASLPKALEPSLSHFLQHIRLGKHTIKRSRDGDDHLVATAAQQRAAAATKLITACCARCLHDIECGKMAALIFAAATRPLEDRLADLLQLLEVDTARSQPLLQLHHLLDAGHSLHMRDAGSAHTSSKRSNSSRIDCVIVFD
jgi:hypothetical protein